MKHVDYFDEAKKENFDGISVSNDQQAFQMEFDEAIKLVASGFVSGSKAGVKNYRRWILPRLPYSLIYREQSNDIVVVAFAHHKRKPGYWKRRLKP